MRRFLVGLAILATVMQTPTMARADDRQIAQQIVKSLEAEKSKGSLHDFNIGLHVEEGAVYLTGHVASREQERLALDAARKPDGVKQVFNEMEIIESKPRKKSNEPASQAADTASKKAEAKPAATKPLAEAKPVAFTQPEEVEQQSDAASTDEQSAPETTETASKIEKAAQQPVSSPKQEADSATAKELVKELTQQVTELKNTPIAKPLAKEEPGKSTGVLLQINQAVKKALESTRTAAATQSPQPKKATLVRTASASRETSLADAKRIATEIIDKFRAEKERGNLRRFGIDVEVDHGVVWLKGTVASAEHQMLALDIARHVSGVTKVVNDLTITGSGAPVPRPVATRQDDAIAQEVVQLLQQYKERGDLRGFGIDVQVDSGTIWLSGYVSNPRQQDLVLEAARRIAGVQQVVNDLVIRGAESARALPEGYQAVQYSEQTTSQQPLAYAPAHPVNHQASVPGSTPVPMMGGHTAGIAPARYDHPQMPGYAWPSYAAHPNYGAVTYPKQYSASAWPYIGPFYPYPQVPLGWRKVTLEWDDGWWHLDFKDRHHR